MPVVGTEMDKLNQQNFAMRWKAVGQYAQHNTELKQIACGGIPPLAAESKRRRRHNECSTSIRLHACFIVLISATYTFAVAAEVALCDVAFTIDKQATDTCSKHEIKAQAKPIFIRSIAACVYVFLCVNFNSCHKIISK